MEKRYGRDLNPWKVVGRRTRTTKRTSIPLKFTSVDRPRYNKQIYQFNTTIFLVNSSGIVNSQLVTTQIKIIISVKCFFSNTVQKHSNFTCLGR